MNFLKMFQLMQLVASMLPLVRGMVEVAETAFPGAGQGAKKLDMVVQTVSGALSTFGTHADQVSAVVDQVKGITSGLVSAMNASGAFLKAPAQPTSSSTSAAGFLGQP